MSSSIIKLQGKKPWNHKTLIHLTACKTKNLYALKIMPWANLKVKLGVKYLQRSQNFKEKDQRRERGKGYEQGTVYRCAP